MDYVKQPDEIYRLSFAAIKAQTDLSHLDADEGQVATRLIHACGMINVVDDLVISTGAVAAGRRALALGAPIICDVKMVVHGITTRLLPAQNKLLCALGTDAARAAAARFETTQTAGGIEALKENMGGAIIVIGNAPTALFHLLEGLDKDAESGWQKPALIVGIPVGFVGAQESKDELIANPRGVPFITVKGQRGGSAMAASVVNAIAAGLKTKGTKN